MAQRLWGRAVGMVVKSSPSAGALSRDADGVLGGNGTLTAVNRGGGRPMGRADPKGGAWRSGASVATGKTPCRETVGNIRFS